MACRDNALRKLGRGLLCGVDHALGHLLLCKKLRQKHMAHRTSKKKSTLSIRKSKGRRTAPFSPANRFLEKNKTGQPKGARHGELLIKHTMPTYVCLGNNTAVHRFQVHEKFICCICDPWQNSIAGDPNQEHEHQKLKEHHNANLIQT